MFRCERCGANFTHKDARGIADCPACYERDGVRAPLTFKLFSSVSQTPATLERFRRAARTLGGSIRK